MIGGRNMEYAMEYVCLECGRLFEDTKHYVQTHGLDTPPYEEWDGCPYCSGDYTRAHICSECGEYIIDNYIKTTSGARYCAECFMSYELGDEY